MIVSESERNFTLDYITKVSNPDGVSLCLITYRPCVSDNYVSEAMCVRQYLSIGSPIILQVICHMWELEMYRSFFVQFSLAWLCTGLHNDFMVLPR